MSSIIFNIVTITLRIILIGFALFRIFAWGFFANDNSIFLLIPGIVLFVAACTPLRFLYPKHFLFWALFTTYIVGYLFGGISRVIYQHQYFPDIFELFGLFGLCFLNWQQRKQSCHNRAQVIKGPGSN